MRVLLSEEKLQALADEAVTSPVTILKRIVGLPVRTSAGRRADAVLARHGVVPPAATGGLHAPSGGRAP